MRQITLPQEPKLVRSEGNRGLFVIDNLYPGYGLTLGNSMRRVLLSSLPGAAIVGVKIKGVKHEFSTIPNVSEDVIEIILNLKKIRFKLFTDKVIDLSLIVRGEKDVKASDIQKNSDIEVVNKDVHIATLTSKKAELEMEIKVAPGLGYEPIERQKKEKLEIGYIAVDAIYTPVKKVNFVVENMRVGDRTDFNRLNIDIETDGTITPQDAFKEAAKILVNQFKVLTGLDKTVKEKKSKKANKEKAKKVEIEDVGITKIEDLKLSSRTQKALMDNGIKTVSGILRKSEDSLKEIEGLGGKGIKEIKRVLGKLGFTLKE